MKRYIFLLITCIILAQCSQEEPEMIDRESLTTYDIIQKEIFDKACISCHQAGTTFARQSGLILTDDVSYDQLVNRLPNNAAAKADGLILVGQEGLASIYNSFLWEKINTPDFAHFYDDHPEYGDLMPLGGRSLTNGELRFVSDWIMAGAPDTGRVSDIALLQDEQRFEIPTEAFSRLTPPTQGLQLNIGPFDIMPNTEREFHYYQPLNTSEDIYINRVEITMREGSHHCILYDFPREDFPAEEVYRDFYKPDGSFDVNNLVSILNTRFVFGTQWRDTDYSYPPGVALRIPAGTGFDINSHYVNQTDAVKMGEVSINIHTTPKAQVQKVAENLFESFENFELPAGKVTTLERTSKFDEQVNLFQLTSHAHKHMTEFQILIDGGSRDGELIYITRDWEHPPLLTFDPPIVLNKGEGLKAVATYDNDTNKTLEFGLLSEDEMMIMFGAYYID